MRRKSRPYYRSADALTLIELLVVVTVIGLLAALLLPALTQVKAHARQGVCSSNLRQLGLAVQLYADDWGDTLPRSDNSLSSDATCWFYAIDSYLLQMVPPDSAAPQQKIALIKQDPVWASFDPGARVNFRTIKMNRKLIGQQSVWNPTSSISSANPGARRRHIVATTASTVLLFDGRCEDGNSPADKARYDGWEPYVSRRHHDGANVLFLDNHVEFRKETPQAGGTGWQSNQTRLDWWVE